MEFKTFKTVKRNWHDLHQVLSHGNIMIIGKSLYNKIYKQINEEKTDGVILIKRVNCKDCIRVEKLIGTIHDHDKFLLFRIGDLKPSEKKQLKDINTEYIKK